MSLTRRLFLRTGAAAGIAVAAPATATMAVSTAAASGVANSGLSPEIAELYSACRRARRAVKTYGPVHTEAEEEQYALRQLQPQRPQPPAMTVAESAELREMKVGDLWKGGQPASYHARFQQYEADLAAFEEAAASAPRDEHWEEIEATWAALVSAEDDAARRLFRSPARNIHDMAIKAAVAERLYLMDAGFEALSKDIRRMARVARKGGAS